MREPDLHIEYEPVQLTIEEEEASTMFRIDSSLASLGLPSFENMLSCKALQAKANPSDCFSLT